MRILHTSDWHLGRSFHGEGMLTHQAAYVDHLLATITEEKVDLVVVAGDVYDRALPPVDAVALANETFERLADSRARVVVTSGNHDSARRLGFGSRLIDRAGLHLRTDAGQVGTPVVLDDEHGPVTVYGLPYLDPDTARQAWSLDQRSHRAALGEAMRRVRADMAQRPGARTVVVAHAFVAGGASSESERDISVGGVSIVPTSLFDGIDYTALGHLHGRQTLTETIRYSGSPLAYSFSEADHLKGSWLVELGLGGVVAADFVPAPVPRRLARVSGSLSALCTDPRFAEHEDAWLQATVTDATRPTKARDHLQERFPHLLSLHFVPEGAPTGDRRPSVRGKSDHEIALDFLAQVRGEPATEAEAMLLRDACECSSADPEADLVVSA